MDYKIEFESDRVKVTNALAWSRNHNGPNNQKSGWNPAFDFWSESWANATVLNAAYECRVQVNQKRKSSNNLRVMKKLHGSPHLFREC